MGDVLPKRFRVNAAFCEVSALDENATCYVETRDALNLVRVVSQMSERIHIHVREDGVGKTGLHIVPMDEIAPSLAEIVMDDSNRPAVQEMNLDAVPAIIVGEDYAMAGPFRQKAVVGFSLVGATREYPQTVQQSIESAARASGGIELIVAENKGDSGSFLRNIDTFIENRASVVIEYSPPAELGSLAAEKLSHSGIALIGVDIPIPGSIYLGVNNYEAGFVAGEKAAEFARHEWPGSNPTAVLVDMQDHNEGVISRLQGIEDCLRRRLGIDDDQIQRVSCPNKLDEAMRELRPRLEALDAERCVMIFGFNAVATIAAYRSVEGRNDRENFAVVGQNLSTEIRQELHRPGSRLIGSVTYHPEQYGTEIMRVVRSILNGEPIGPSYFTRHEWIPASWVANIYG
jgi:ABC-type sugar transport system substrate-binding protein